MFKAVQLPFLVPSAAERLSSLNLYQSIQIQMSSSMLDVAKEVMKCQKYSEISQRYVRTAFFIFYTTVSSYTLTGKQN